ncbi:hypothetical protein [Paenibacillus rigui]|uniref:DnaD domain-containing protein n=1 Tax=Paenibacillus rigui TaxID=554312 RepID=A0A229UKU5_9BACL|nr:hypothetical protein [Paenibacillus rigui]OXM83991.1 hypothetical protein CF651_23045 [Paenibacillus rigui]
MEGWVSIHRQIMDHWIYKDAEYLKVWLEMLLRARFSKDPGNELIDGELITVKQGEFIFGRVKWSERLGIGEQRIRTLVKKLMNEEMISFVSSHRKCTLYRICNYENYQNFIFKDESHNKLLTKSYVSYFSHDDNQQIMQAYQEIAGNYNHDTNHLLTSIQPSANHQLTTKEQSNKDNKEINNIHSTGEMNLNEDDFKKVSKAFAEIHDVMEMPYSNGPILTRLLIEGIPSDHIIGVIKEKWKHGVTTLKYYEGAIRDSWYVSQSPKNDRPSFGSRYKPRNDKPKLTVVNGETTTLRSPEEREAMRRRAQMLDGK